jgi:two-component system alkaline phosphatase synthesis response regulator PhoP
MQQHEEVRSLTDNAVMINDYCEITNRILIISPRPASLRTLVAELAERCYDVLLLHHSDDPLLNMMQGNIVVVDRTVDKPSSATEMLHVEGASPILALVSKRPTPSSLGEEWVEWPSPIEEVIDKIKQLSLKHTVPQDDSHKYVFKEIVLDPGRMTVTRSGAKVDLTKTEYDLLRTIMAADGKVMTRQTLLNGIWGEQYFGGSNAVDVHIKSLRQKLKDDPKEPRYIATVRGAGYRLADL